MADKFDKLGPIFDEIGHELGRIVGGDPDKTYLYAELQEGVVGAGVFKDEGNSVRYFDPSRPLIDLLIEAWEVEEPGKRWEVIEYAVVGKEFDAVFKFPEELNPDEYEDERRDVALHARYGDKPVIYPPMPEH
ncbi:hypothetical protein [Sphingomonas sp. HMP6]|uniref:hypothetical protein n=1 Tax=Sphingomonas sp. HMP6 TaxID=1517551 RepID=UPI001596428B|nr:hypothetical protein [Sphingomonas sp. HMP6]BCA60610.1 hypothetical protein HMP06_3379 [Sphingomonas sp. HMP6]